MKTPPSETGQSLPTRMSLKSLYSIIPKFSEEQRKAVIEIGFESLLGLSLSKCHGQLSRYLVESFDYCKTTIVFENNEKVDITEDDVFAMYNISRGKLPIVEVTNDNYTPEYAELLKSWRERWNIAVGSPITQKMSEEIIARRDYRDDFKRDFVVFVVSSMLKGHQSRMSNYKILYSLMNVNEIRNCNWCLYTLKSLSTSVEKWKKKPTSFFTGPLTFLLVSNLYLFF